MAALPAYIEVQFAGFAVKPESPVLRSPMESGPAKQARVKSRVLTQYQVQLRIESQADYAAFWAWVDNDIAGGAGWFDWTHPVSGAVVSARIVGGTLEAQPLRRTLDVWQISATFEVWGR